MPCPSIPADVRAVPHPRAAHGVAPTGLGQGLRLSTFCFLWFYFPERVSALEP
jgi:hypothetical protein